MRFVKVVKQSEQSGFEEDINQVLNENERAKLIDIKISSAYHGDRINYLAVLIFVS